MQASAITVSPDRVSDLANLPRVAFITLDRPGRCHAGFRRGNYGRRHRTDIRIRRSRNRRGRDRQRNLSLGDLKGDDFESRIVYRQGFTAAPLSDAYGHGTHLAGIADDQMTSYSSKGPPQNDLVVKPDLVAPGNTIVSLLAPQSRLEQMFPDNRVDPLNPSGPFFDTGNQYFRLSGTSMPVPVVSGTVALMLQQDPTLTPDAVKARLNPIARRILAVMRWLRIGAFFLLPMAVAADD